MSAFKGTPWPWIHERTVAPRGWNIKAREGTYTVAVARDGSGSLENAANARLIAAAPELLEALQYAIEQVPELATVPGIDSAIAKATGGAA